MKTLIKQAQVLQDEKLKVMDVLLADGQIKAFGENLADLVVDEVIDAKKNFLTPGFIDVHVHFREPGFTYKETIKTGSKAAARGGFTTVCAMPNLDPAPDNVEDFTALVAKNKTDGLVHIEQYATITHNLRSEELVDFEALAIEGAFAFTNDGVGIQTAGVMYQAMKEAARLGKAIVAHTEDNSLLFGGVMHAGHRAEELGLPGILNVAESTQIARDVLLAEATGVHYHVCHVSTKESVRVIRQAKQAGIQVTAEVSPHHLLLDENDIPSDDGYYKMNPPLRATEDHKALIAGLLDGTIDMIATDHAPHGQEEKQKSMREAPFGITGSETAFSLLYTHFVRTGIFTLKQLTFWMSEAPAKTFGLSAGRMAIGAPADLTLLDLSHETTINEADYASMGVNTPFTGQKVFGQTVMTLVAGRLVYKKEQ